MRTRTEQRMISLALALSISLLGGCENSTGRGKSPSPKIEPQEYFPLAIGNRWVNRRTLAPGKEPLYYYEFTVEEQRSGSRPEGTTLARYGREVSLRAGIEKYEIAKRTDKGFVVRMAGDPEEGHVLEPYKLMELHELVWAIRNWSGDNVVWEFRRGINLGSLGRTGQMVGLLTTDISLTVRGSGQKITSVHHAGNILVPAGAFAKTIKNTIEFKGRVESDQEPECSEPVGRLPTACSRRRCAPQLMPKPFGCPEA